MSNIDKIDFKKTVGYQILSKATQTEKARKESTKQAQEKQPVKTEPEPKKDSYKKSVAYQVLSKPVQTEEARVVSTKQAQAKIKPELTHSEKYGDPRYIGERLLLGQKPSFTTSYVLEQKQENIEKQYQKTLTDIKTWERGTDPFAQYKFGEPVEGYFKQGEIVSGEKVKSYYGDVYSEVTEEYSRFKSSIEENPIMSGRYIKRGEQYYYATPELLFTLEHAEPKEIKNL